MRLVIVLLAVAFLITGCSNVRTYTFKKDRVDQKMEEGNRGYILGTPPPAEKREGLKRTMIGADIEIPIMAWEKNEKPEKSTENAPKAVESKAANETENAPKAVESKAANETENAPKAVENKAANEEEWIK